MKNSKGFPTNALFGFVNMINKIVNEERNNISLEYILKVINMADSKSVKTYKKEMIETSKQRIRAGYGNFY